MGIPPSTREAVMTALFQRLQALQPTHFVTVSRKLKMWSDVTAEEQPALFMSDHTENQVSSSRGLPRKTEWDVVFFIYARAPDENTLGTVVLNNLLDALEDALVPSVSDNVLTLGGTVYRVWGDGEIRKDPGDLDGQAVAIYPMKIRPP